jgi:hypothetical protein
MGGEISGSGCWRCRIDWPDSLVHRDKLTGIQACLAAGHDRDPGFSDVSADLPSTEHWFKGGWVGDLTVPVFEGRAEIPRGGEAIVKVYYLLLRR